MSRTPDDPEQSAPAFDFSGVPDNTSDLQQSADWFAAPDVTLRRMSYWADSVGEGTVITLVVPGGLISGFIDSAANYFQSLSRQLRGGVARFGDEKKDNAAKEYAEFFFDQTAEFYRNQIKSDEEAFKNGELKEPRYVMTRHIHLKDAYYTAPGQPSIPLQHTRVLLSQVAAWSLGGTTRGVDHDPWT